MVSLAARSPDRHTSASVVREPRRRRPDRIFFELLCRQLSAFPFREKLGENNGMIHGRITRCIYQCCPATGHLPQVLYRRMLRFQFVAVTALEFSQSVRTMIEPSSQCRP